MPYKSESAPLAEELPLTLNQLRLSPPLVSQQNASKFIFAVKLGLKQESDPPLWAQGPFLGHALDEVSLPGAYILYTKRGGCYIYISSTLLVIK